MGLAGVPTLVERDRELAAVRDLAEAAAGGAGGLVVVEGEPGIGKTALLRAASAMAREHGLRVCAARCGELEQEFAFGLVRDLLGPSLTECTPEQRVRLLAGAAALAEPVLSVVPAAAHQAATDVHAALHGLYWLTAGFATAQPTVLVVDDAHWCDLASLRFLGYLARRLDGLRVGLLLAMRPHEQPAQQNLLQRIADEPAAVLLRPRPLGRAAVATMVATALNRDVDGEFGGACADATGGNPFLITELLAALQAGEVEPVGVQVQRLAATTPDAVRRAVLGRLNRLPDGATMLARAAAVLGDGAAAKDMAQLAGLPATRTTVLLDALSLARIIEPRLPVVFVHPLVRSAVLDSLGPAGRAAAHRSAAQLLAAAGAPAEALVPHLMASAPVADPWTVGQLRAAATLALARGAPEAAVRYLRRALAEPPAAEHRGAVLLALGTAEMQAGLPDSADHLAEAAELAGSPTERARARLALGRAHLRAARVADAVGIYQHALDDLDGAEPALAAELEVELVNCATSHVDLRPVAVARFARMARDPAPTGRVECMMLAALAIEEVVAHGSRERAIALAELALTDDLLLDDRAGGLLPSAILALTLAGRIRRSVEVCERAIARHRVHGNVQGFVVASVFRGYAAYCLGDLGSSLADTRSASELALAHEVPFFGAVAAAWAAFALVETGELEAAEEAIACYAFLFGPEAPLGANFLLSARGQLRLAQGRPADAAADLRECGRRQELYSRSPAMFRWRPQLAIALLAMGAREEAASVAADGLVLAREWGAPHVLAEALHVAGAVAGGEAGLEMIKEAVDVAGASEAGLEHARALCALGGSLLRAGRHREAREPLRAALDVALRCEATVLAGQVQDELVSAGAQPRRLRTSGVTALTATERRVVETVAGGLTNREAAQALFVAEKTVETHLGHAYAKLGISSRGQLRAALAGHGRG